MISLYVVTYYKFRHFILSEYDINYFKRKHEKTVSYMTQTGYTKIDNASFNVSASAMFMVWVQTYACTITWYRCISDCRAYKLEKLFPTEQP